MTEVLPSFTQWLAVLMNDLQDDYDVVICIDSDDINRHGPVGGGKSDIAHWIARAMNPSFNIYTDMVVKDDLAEFKQNLDDRHAYKVIWLDEAEWFLFKQWWQKPWVKPLTPEFMSNRKERRIWILCVPLIWDIVGFMRDARVQWRLKVQKRGEAALFMRGPRMWNDWERDKWGTYITTFKDIPPTPDGARAQYEERVFGHKCVKDRCVTRMEKS